MSEQGEIEKGFGGLLGTGPGGRLSITAQCHDHVMQLAGVPAKKFFFDFISNFETGALVAKYYNLDSSAGGFDSYNIELEALGAKMIYGENSMPTIDFRDPLVKSPEDLEKLKKKQIDFTKDGRFPLILEMGRSQFMGGMSMCMICSPFSLAVGMMGYPALIKTMRRKPKFAHEIFTYIVDDVLTPWIRTQNEHFDCLMGIGADAWASIPNLSIKEMNEWVVPYNQRLAKNAKKFGVLIMNYSGDYCEEDLEKFDPKILHDSFDIQISSMGGAASLFPSMGRWHEYPLKAVREYTARYREKNQPISLIMGFNARLLRDGPVDKIVDTIKRYIDTFARDHNLSIFLSNISADTPSDHIHAAVAATHTYGRLPIADNLDDIEFKMPKNPSFEEWRKEVMSTPEGRESVAHKKEQERKGLAGLLWQQMGKINDNTKFKEQYADTKMSFMYNLTDQRYGALIKVENGRLEVDHVRNDEETLKSLEVDGLLACPAGLFFDFTGGKISKIAMIGKMLTGKLKVKGMKKMKELGNIMALMS